MCMGSVRFLGSLVKSVLHWRAFPSENVVSPIEYAVVWNLAPLSIEPFLRFNEKMELKISAN